MFKTLPSWPVALLPHILALFPPKVHYISAKAFVRRCADKVGRWDRATYGNMELSAFDVDLATDFATLFNHEDMQILEVSLHYEEGGTTHFQVDINLLSCTIRQSGTTSLIVPYAAFAEFEPRSYTIGE